MSIINEKNLRTLIREAITRHEACCLARHSPMYGIEIQNRRLYGKKDDRKALVKSLADIIQNRAELKGKDWDAMRRDWEIMLRSYGKNVNQRYKDLDACHIDTPGTLGQDEVDACGADEAFVAADDKEDEWNAPSGAVTQVLPLGERSIKSMIREELTKADEADIKKLIAKEISSSQTEVARAVKATVEDEITKALKTKAVKDDVAEITKKILKRLYKDLSLQQPYVIDRIKV
tara:strand:+ start:195 stop:893 length:699 start_codon:yes stop_codon:yes gene_type:complete